LLLGKNLLFSLSSHGRRENLTFLKKNFEKIKKRETSAERLISTGCEG
jgi:hypothetical protein